MDFSNFNKNLSLKFFFIYLFSIFNNIMFLVDINLVLYMDSEGLNLKQCGQTSINIFPTHPEIQAYSTR